jgi:hypothetical protein
MPMIVKTLQVVVHAEHDTLWNLLMDRLENPARYTPGITEARIVERTDDTIIREMKEHGEHVKEKIEIMPYDSQITHELLEHPQFTGTIVTRIVRTARQSPVAPQYLEYDLDLVTKSFKVEGALRGEHDVIKDVQTEMKKLKSRAEEMETRENRNEPTRG